MSRYGLEPAGQGCGSIMQTVSKFSFYLKGARNCFVISGISFVFECSECMKTHIKYYERQMFLWQPALVLQTRACCGEWSKDGAKDKMQAQEMCRKYSSFAQNITAQPIKGKMFMPGENSYVHTSLLQILGIPRVSPSQSSPPFWGLKTIKQSLSQVIWKRRRIWVSVDAHVGGCLRLSTIFATSKLSTQGKKCQQKINWWQHHTETRSLEVYTPKRKSQ